MALTLHGVPRIPADLDLLVDPEEGNLQCFLETLGFDSFDPDESAALAQLKDEETKAPYCLRLSESSGHQVRAFSEIPVPFGEAFERRTCIPLGSLTIYLLSLEDLILIKSGSDDPADLADAKGLERIRQNQII